MIQDQTLNKLKIYLLLLLIVSGKNDLYIGCETSNQKTENDSEKCNDGLDNDGDGLFDCNDPDCTIFNVCQRTEDAGFKDTEQFDTLHDKTVRDSLVDIKDIYSDECNLNFYPCPPYGENIGDTIEDLGFIPVNSYAQEYTDMDGILYLHNFYQKEGLKGLFIYVAAGWCPVCSLESADLQTLYEEYHSQGIEFLGIIFEDNEGRTVTVEYGSDYAEYYGWQFPAAIDIPFITGKYTDSSALPFNMFIDLSTMKIVYTFNR